MKIIICFVVHSIMYETLPSSLAYIVFARYVIWPPLYVRRTENCSIKQNCVVSMKLEHHPCCCRWQDHFHFLRLSSFIVDKYVYVCVYIYIYTHTETHIYVVISLICIQLLVFYIFDYFIYIT